MNVVTRTRSARTRPAACLLTLAALLGAGSACAQSASRLDQTVWGRVGVFQAHVDSLIRLDYVGSEELGLQGAGTTLSFERTLGLRKTQTVPDVRLGLRLFERGRLELESTSLRRSARKTLVDDDIVVNGTTYSLSAQLLTEFESRVQRLSAGYSFYKSEQSEFGAQLGVQFTKYRISLTGQGRFNNEPPEERTVTQEDSGPLPTFGVYGTTALSGNWSLDARADYLPVDSKRAKGKLVTLETNLYYRISPTVSAALGYRSVQYKVDRKSSGELTGRFEYTFRGPQLLLEVGF